MEQKQMTRAEVEAWRAGWKHVKAMEMEQAKRKSYKARWREINILFNFAYELGLLASASEAELGPIRARWVRLKASYR